MNLPRRSYALRPTRRDHDLPNFDRRPMLDIVNDLEAGRVERATVEVAAKTPEQSGQADLGAGSTGGHHGSLRFTAAFRMPSGYGFGAAAPPA